MRYPTILISTFTALSLSLTINHTVHTEEIGTANWAEVKWANVNRITFQDEFSSFNSGVTKLKKGQTATIKATVDYSGDLAPIRQSAVTFENVDPALLISYDENTLSIQHKQATFTFTVTLNQDLLKPALFTVKVSDGSPNDLHYLTPYSQRQTVEQDSASDSGGGDLVGEPTDKPENENKPDIPPTENPDGEQQPEIEPGEEPDTEMKPEPDNESKPETTPEEKPDVSPEPDTDSENETKPETKPGTDNETENPEKPDVSPEPDTDSSNEVTPEEKPDTDNEVENPETPNRFPEEKPDVAPEMPEKTPETNITAKEISTQKDEKKESQKINTTIRQINEEKQNTHTQRFDSPHLAETLKSSNDTILASHDMKNKQLPKSGEAQNKVILWSGIILLSITTMFSVKRFKQNR
ncbi:LPXTG cell wall anchor domain-containing protein [Enterococcus faecium]|uniref:LPXTG cell wall anchor domain-containing protein n=1 Tax=Enterococcus faecium TaxID=1352 RepID=A0A7V7KWA1_ENTFC|nr:LPXTG cell wall anchor domain-containing protein [Enterococcus faecium]KAA0692922.1 LPXTG cell wall anchor domain-containing protein [Enterococcus faecium]MBK5026150.1 LPXTG cell wall anchor domain-containing protein [Enterococcus faecium]MBK5036871.1 LPXTG cell wall anchor domain-containing protein [Enterococcus faecium]MBK5042090.1 LPXTG cell wall anchor domain-containing protein [Enterococcus faecium]MBK5066808.1 LPXTG cell wall anchor domain-containing protein [Enterococcus faecium]